MDIFDMIGPVMVGPSSSHTAGACRIGRVANKMASGQLPDEVEITLSGSFARTYKGHGTDRAILAGILGYHSWHSELKDALESAKERGMKYSFVCEDLPRAHPNTARIRYTLPDGTVGEVQGCSVGGGNIRVDMIDGLHVDFSADCNTILVLHKDRPGVIADVTNLMRSLYSDVNIGGFKLSRDKKGGEAVMTIELDSLPPEEMVADLKKIRNVDNAILIKKV